MILLCYLLYQSLYYPKVASGGSHETFIPSPTQDIKLKIRDMYFHVKGGLIIGWGPGKKKERRKNKKLNIHSLLVRRLQ